MARPSPDLTPPDPRVQARPWLASYPPGVPPTFELPPVALTRFLDDAARDFPDQAALVVDGDETSFVELRHRVDRLATGLADAGVTEGARVLVALPVGAAAPTVLFALWRLGAIAVPVDPHLRDDLLAAVVEDAEVAAAVGTGPSLAALAETDAAPDLRIAVSGDEWAPRRLRDRVPRPGRRRRREASDPGATVPLADLLDGVGPRMAPTPPTPDHPAVLAYRPRARDLRGVVLRHGNLVANAFQGRLWVPDIQAGRERILVTDPLHLTVPLTLGVLTGVLAAATLVLVDRPDARTLATVVERDRPTLWPTGPHRLAQLLDPAERKRDLGSLRVIVTGGAPVDQQVAADVERRTGGARVREGYGLAEASPLTHAQPVYGRVNPGHIGLPVTDTVAIVVDPVDLATSVPTGEPGMLLVHGPQVAQGYWRRPEATTATFRDGWLVTGDLARVDEGGSFQVIGRADEVVRRGDELIAPRAVEAVLARHPAIHRAGVVGDPDTVGEPGLVAAVVLTHGRGPAVVARRHRVDEDGLLAHCRALLPGPAVPDRIEVLERLPEDEFGELARDELRETLLGR